jgi:hypothetical protein
LLKRQLEAEARALERQKQQKEELLKEKEKEKENTGFRRMAPVVEKAPEETSKPTS